MQIMKLLLNKALLFALYGKRGFKAKCLHKWPFLPIRIKELKPIELIDAYLLGYRL